MASIGPPHQHYAAVSTHKIESRYLSISIPNGDPEDGTLRSPIAASAACGALPLLHVLITRVACTNEKCMIYGVTKEAGLARSLVS